MTPDELRAHLSRLGLSQRGAAAFLKVNTSTLRRWAQGEVPVPHAVALLLPRLKKDDVK